MNSRRRGKESISSVISFDISYLEYLSTSTHGILEICTEHPIARTKYPGGSQVAARNLDSKKRLLADDQHRTIDTYPGLLEAGICAGMLSTLHTYAPMGLDWLPLLNSKQQEDLSSQKQKLRELQSLTDASGRRL